MRYRLVIALIVVGLVPILSFSQAKALRTPDGQPDLQGVWSFATITPLEKPAELAGKEFFTPKEAAEYERQILKRNNMDRRDGPVEDDVRRAYNDFWWDRGTRIVKTRRTSLIIDPPDGKIPSLTAAAKERQKERQNANLGHEFDGPENRPLQERCIIWASTGPPMMPTAYNNNIRILQSPGYVTILVEMIHDARVIRLDGSPHIASNVHQWRGDSRGRWEGDTLVVETTNFTGKTSFRGSSEKMRLIERFKRMDADTLLYQYTVDDLSSFEKPWTVEIPLPRSEAPMFEYACHEGNYAMTGGLAGARAQEKNPD
ncbi:MAG: hypothetical protein DMG16_27920 [Acidobacteria bacterium]|nr:MAG: hypothetical protein DMG16_27920 [Acidobacteriota bacterium]